MSAEYDFSRFREKLSGLSGALFGRGAGDGDIQRLMRSEFGQLHAQIGDSIGPKTLEKAKSITDYDVKQHIFPINSRLNVNEPSKTYSDFTWLYASPPALLTIHSADIQTDLSGKSALQILRADQKAGSRATGTTGRQKKWFQLGVRGKQHVMLLNRVAVSRSAYAEVRHAILNRMGQLRASFYVVAKHYAQRVKVPGWIESKFPDVFADGKVSYHDNFTGATGENFIESKIRGAGLISNDKLRAKIQGAIDFRAQILFRKLVKILQGHKYAWDTGQVFRPADETIISEDYG